MFFFESLGTGSELELFLKKKNLTEPAPEIVELPKPT